MKTEIKEALEELNLNKGEQRISLELGQHQR